FDGGDHERPSTRSVMQETASRDRTDHSPRTHGPLRAVPRSCRSKSARRSNRRALSNGWETNTALEEKQPVLSHGLRLQCRFGALRACASVTVLLVDPPDLCSTRRTNAWLRPASEL